VIRTWRWLLLAILAALLVTLSGCLATRGQNASPTPDSPVAQQDAPPTPDLPVAPIAGARAPDFTLSDLNGEVWTLSALRGKVVLLNFWATW
jgi:cytochrome oxidase Cu insertion factor (SCO1/SenC/PrrC family)